MGINNEKGAVVIIVAICLVLFLGITAFVIDIGRSKSQKVHLQNTADAAALAGAREYIDGTPTASNIESVVEKYVALHGVSTDDIDEVILSKRYGSTENNAVTVKLKIKVTTFFASIFGYDFLNVGAMATAIAAPISGIKGLIPLYFQENDLPDPLVYGVPYDSHTDSTVQPGNWGLTNFNNTPNEINFADWFTNGYDEMLKIGDTITTQPGNGIQSVRTEVNSILHQTRVIALVEEIIEPGRTTIVITGFIAIEITNIVTGNNDIQEIHVKFLERVEMGEVDPEAPNYKLQGLRLIE